MCDESFDIAALCVLSVDVYLSKTSAVAVLCRTWNHYWPTVSNTFFFLEPKTPATPPIDIVDDVLKAAEDVQNDIVKPATTEITPGESKEKKDKLIQKETMETGSVSIILFYHVV